MEAERHRLLRISPRNHGKMELGTGDANAPGVQRDENRKACIYLTGEANNPKPRVYIPRELGSGKNIIRTQQLQINSVSVCSCPLSLR